MMILSKGKGLNREKQRCDMYTTNEKVNKTTVNIFYKNIGKDYKKYRDCANINRVEVSMDDWKNDLLDTAKSLGLKSLVDLQKEVQKSLSFNKRYAAASTYDHSIFDSVYNQEENHGK